MEDLPAGWLYELEMEDSDLINQCHISPAEVFDFRDLSVEAHQLPQEASDLTADDSCRVTKPGSCGGASRARASPQLPVFGQPGPVSAILNREIPASPEMGNDEYRNLFNVSPNRSCSNVVEDGRETVESKSLSRPPLQAKNHIMAERKRRERLNQKLISLAALIPGLKKMDKASILGDATRHIKHLEERVKQLEREKSKKEHGKPTVINAKRSRSRSDEETSSSEDSSDDNFNPNNKPFPELDMRVSEKHVVLKIHCKKQEGLLGRILNELDNFSINVVSFSTLPFMDAAVDITIIGKLTDEKGTKIENPLKCLRLAILKFL